MDTLESLRARIAELEAEKKALDLRVCAGEQSLRSAQRTIVYSNENGARSASERDEWKARAEAAERDLREMTAAKERATEAYRQAEQQRFSAEAKLAGLLEAVGPFVAQERVFLSKFPSTTPDDTRWWDRACLTFWDSRKLIAAFDAAK